MFYRAYLQWGLAGSWGKPWQPNTASNSLQHFNNAARTQLFSTFCCVPKNLRSSESLPHELLQVFAAIKTSLLLFLFFLHPSSSPSKQINHQSLTGEIEVETPRATAFKLATGQSFFFRLTKLLSIWEKKLSYTLKCISEAIAISKSHWRLSNHTAVSLSLPPPPSPPSSLPPFSFYLYLSHVPSIPLLLLLLLCFCSALTSFLLFWTKTDAANLFI